MKRRLLWDGRIDLIVQDGTDQRDPKDLRSCGRLNGGGGGVQAGNKGGDTSRGET
jgi:hypothetical protein